MTKNLSFSSICIAVLGFALYWTYIFTTSFSMVLSVPAFDPVFGNQLCRVFGHLGAALCLFTAWKFSTYFENISKPYIALIIVTAPWSTITTAVMLVGVDLPLFVLLLAWLITGASAGLTILVIMRLFSRLETQVSTIAAGCSILVSAVFYILIIRTDTIPALIIIACALPVAAILTFLTATELDAQAERFPDVAKERQNSLEREKEQAISLKQSLSTVFQIGAASMFLYGIVSGSTNSLSIPLGGEDVFSTEVFVAFLGAGIVLTFLSRLVAKRKKVFSYLQTVTVCFLALCLLPLGFVDTSMRTVLIALLVFGFTCYDVSNWNAMTRVIRHEHLSVVRVCGIGRCLNSFGVSIGWFVGYLLLVTSNTDAQGLIVLSLALIFLLVFVLSLPVIQAEKTETETEKKAYFIETCNKISARSGLSNREAEVLIQIAKGRSAERVAQQLYISTATAKTHIYHIYKKMHIHTQQDLMELVEKERKKTSKE